MHESQLVFKCNIPHNSGVMKRFFLAEIKEAMPTLFIIKLELTDKFNIIFFTNIVKNYKSKVPKMFKTKIMMAASMATTVLTMTAPAITSTTTSVNK